jgi:hypothetical protein
MYQSYSKKVGSKQVAFDRLPRAKAREDILYVLTKEVLVGDVSVVHLGTARYRQAAAATPGGCRSPEGH